jgi:hypothetical protein
VYGPLIRHPQVLGRHGPYLTSAIIAYVDAAANGSPDVTQSLLGLGVAHIDVRISEVHVHCILAALGVKHQIQV